MLPKDKAAPELKKYRRQITVMQWLDVKTHHKDIPDCNRYCEKRVSSNYDSIVSEPIVRKDCDIISSCLTSCEENAEYPPHVEDNVNGRSNQDDEADYDKAKATLSPLFRCLEEDRVLELQIRHIFGRSLYR